MKRTPLYNKHCTLGGKLIDFGGWELPVQYAGIIEEHECVRNSAGIFDVSHMGEISVKGPDATNFIQKLVTNDIGPAESFQAVYSPMCYPDGGVVDDLLVYKYDGFNYLLIVNAANTDKDFEWMKENIHGDTEIENVSDKYAQLAVQGPRAQTILQKMTDFPLEEIKFYHFKPQVKVGGFNVIISRTGYTGEDGFEIYLPSEDSPVLWDEILKTGSEEGIVPVGLGARDTLRFEAALPLYGHEISKDITPLEAGLGKFVKLGKVDFIGRQSLAEQSSKGLKRKLVGFEMIDRGIPRGDYEVHADGKKIGVVTTGSYSPTLKKNIGLALVESEYSIEGTVFDIVIRNKELKAKVVKVPFYSKRYKK